MGRTLPRFPKSCIAVGWFEAAASHDTVDNPLLFFTDLTYELTVRSSDPSGKPPSDCTQHTHRVQ